MSYLKDLPCAGCGTETTYCFPDKPTAHYCYCEFRFEIGEQIAREIEATCHADCGVTYNCKHSSSQVLTCHRGCTHIEDAAIARGEK